MLGSEGLIDRGQTGAMTEDGLIRSRVTLLTECAAWLMSASKLQHGSNVHYNISADLQLGDRECCQQ